MLDAFLWLVTSLGGGVLDIFRALANPAAWLDWSNPEALIRFIYYGASVEFFFAVFAFLVILTLVGLWQRALLWGVVRGLETTQNVIGRFFAWAGLIMVLQQVLIVFLQRIFRVSEITVGPFGYVFTRDLSWFAEELKLYNAMIVALCCGYTFVQGSHVRVDLFYAGAKYRTKKIIDMLGSLFFILPMMTLIWLYGWFFMWRHLVNPPLSASDKLDLMLKKSRIIKWKVETIGFSPNGFDGYFLFKVLLVAFAGLMFLQGIAYFYRSLLELLEGPEAEGRHFDKDLLGDETAERVHAIEEHH